MMMKERTMMKYEPPQRYAMSDDDTPADVTKRHEASDVTRSDAAAR